MGDEPEAMCRVCHEPMFASELGPMCRRALQSWKRVDDRWKRSFAGHPEVNPAEREFLEKHGVPPIVHAEPIP